jgi:hypothetical protein
MGPGESSFRSYRGGGGPGGSPARRQGRRSLRELTALALLLVAEGWLLGPSLAKEKKPQTRTVIGTVADEADSPIEGAAVQLTDLQTGKVLDIYSQGGGQYRFADLQFDHDYTVKATYKGASSEVRQVSSLETRSPLVLNLTILKTNK